MKGYYVNVKTSHGTRPHYFRFKKTAKVYARKVRKYSYVKKASIGKR